MSPVPRRFLALSLLLAVSACTQGPDAGRHQQGTTSVQATTTSDPGILSQTDVLPSADTAQFRAEMAALWAGVVQGSTAPALASFFPGAGSATLESVQVPVQYAHWVPPGTCANRVGYYEVANTRLVYLVAGQVRSFGIASLISWRGTWYVVHLGAVVRSGSGGEVDDPEIGPGASAPSSTC